MKPCQNLSLVLVGPQPVPNMCFNVFVHSMHVFMYVCTHVCVCVLLTICTIWQLNACAQWWLYVGTGACTIMCMRSSYCGGIDVHTCSVIVYVCLRACVSRTDYAHG